jgi:proteasome assembly chaperone 3
VRKAERELQTASRFLYKFGNKMHTSTMTDGLQSMDLNGGTKPTPFPAASKQAAGLVNGTQTDVSSIYFADKIMITISQGGRLSQWVCIPSQLQSCFNKTVDSSSP